MNNVFTREVHCRNCGRPTRHRVPILERIFQLQSELYENERYINYACPYCNKLTRAHVPTQGTIYLEEDLRKFPSDLSLYAVSLECAKSGCKSRVILLAPVKGEISEEALLTHIQTNWNNHSAVCEQNHLPFYPFEVAIWEKLT